MYACTNSIIQDSSAVSRGSTKIFSRVEFSCPFSGLKCSSDLTVLVPPEARLAAQRAELTDRADARGGTSGAFSNATIVTTAPLQRMNAVGCEAYLPLIHVRNLGFPACERWSKGDRARELVAAMRISKSLLKLAGVVLWGLGIAWGLAYAWRYETTPTESVVARDRWPAESSCTLASDRPTLVMFVHPHCPCSRASLEELAALMTHCRDRLSAQVMFFQPSSSPGDWSRTDLWESAARIPGVVPRVDAEGVEQRRFGAGVSGEVYVYLPDGQLLFHGGITAGRGHAGENAGRAALESFLLRGEVAARGTPVYGCELHAPKASCCAQSTIAGRKSAP